MPLPITTTWLVVAAFTLFWPSHVGTAQAVVVVVLLVFSVVNEFGRALIALNTAQQNLVAQERQRTPIVYTDNE